jgi:hypothetical protein
MSEQGELRSGIISCIVNFSITSCGNIPGPHLNLILVPPSARLWRPAVDENWNHDNTFFLKTEVKETSNLI